ncbi:TetR/AcrR family transcriptional regulator [Paenibacillus flagellatus]|uniref:TetR/AcrR family transcriptional regulator n=1 Tax=Paenibacillus flagellatus TaxID=2211139 RepID=A0A2V5K8D8_9BACL|nr:TetR/AcrR family transcriptional regulator [Paenibacillus flagellatus]PYI55769.1 TetR/AcrR family transcriptional regulator [Paenibacillus flagellatus]
MSMNPKRKDARHVSDVILKTARELFAEHGVDAVSMHQIAKTAGIGQATLYRRFAQKGELCMELLQEHFDRLTVEIRDILQRDADKSAKTRLEAVLRMLIRFVNEESTWLRAIQADLLSRTCAEEREHFFQSTPYRFMHDLLCGLLKEAQERGETGPTDAVFVAHVLISSLAPPVNLHLRQTYGYTAERIADTFIASFVEPLFKT